MSKQCCSSCGCDDDDCKCKRGKRGHRGHRGHKGPPGPPATGTFALKWSGRVREGDGTVTQSLADAGNDINVSQFLNNRYPFCLPHTAVCCAIWVGSNTLSQAVAAGATIKLLRNGSFFASAPAPATGATTFPAFPPEPFGQGDKIEVQVELPPGDVEQGGNITLTVVVEFSIGATP